MIERDDTVRAGEELLIKSLYRLPLAVLAREIALLVEGDEKSLAMGRAIVLSYVCKRPAPVASECSSEGETVRVTE